MSPGARLSANALTSSPTTAGRQRDVGAGQLGQPVGGRPQRQLGLVILRAPQVRDEDDARPSVAQLLDRRQRRPDPRVVGDRAVVERDVEVDPDKHPLALQLAEVGKGSHNSL